MLDEKHLFPGWTWMGMTAEPQSRIAAYLWKWPEVEALVRKGLELVPVGREDAERRNVRLSNPGFKHGTTQTISVAVQSLHPGESAPGQVLPKLSAPGRGFAPADAPIISPALCGSVLGYALARGGC